MTTRLQIIVAVLTVVMILYIVRMTRQNKIDLRFSLRWVFLCLLVLLIDIFPGILDWLATITGIQLPSNMIFIAAIVLLTLTVYSLTTAVSRLSESNSRLVQETALLRDELRQIQNKEKTSE